MSKRFHVLVVRQVMVDQIADWEGDAADEAQAIRHARAAATFGTLDWLDDPDGGVTVVDAPYEFRVEQAGDDRIGRVHAAVRAELGDRRICPCGATAETFDTRCKANLATTCTGFVVIDEVRARHWRAVFGEAAT